MTTYDFIFSNHHRHRITRHIAFWLTWWIYFIVTYLVPTFPFPGWSMSGPHPVLDKFGLAFFLKNIFIYNSLPIMLAHAAFTYAIISFALPRYFFKRKNFATTTFIFIGMMVVIYIASIGLMYIPYYRSYIIGTRKILPGISELIDLVNRSHLTNLPVVAGFAVMIKLMKRWWLKQKETEQVGREKARAELQLLKAQIHPHFLFNTLNNIYFFTMTASVQAPEMIKKLTAMLHYILNECNQPSVPVEKELKMIQDYIALEKIRYGEQIDIKTEIQEAGNNKMIAPLLLIPFVENSFKHGASKMITHPWVKLRITFEDDMLHFFIINSKPLSHESASRNGSIGLKNVQKRLLLLYPGAHELNIISEPENFTVFLKIQLKELIVSPANADETLQTEEYAMA
ncbi:MAG TPA: histidine kinase [Chitinophagaceae bacterium]|nr:histidine kinase [Chitinophagaceae bacterium]